MSTEKIHMKSSPNKPEYQQVFSSKRARSEVSAGRVFLALFPNNIDMYLWRAENLKWFEFVIMILEVIKVGKIRILDIAKGFTYGFPYNETRHFIRKPYVNPLAISQITIFPTLIISKIMIKSSNHFKFSSRQRYMMSIVVSLVLWAVHVTLGTTGM